MAIEGIGPVDPVPQYESLDRSAPASHVAHADSVEISAEARATSAALRIATEIALSSPDVRTELVAAAARNLQDSSYPDTQVLETVRDRVLESFGG